MIACFMSPMLTLIGGTASRNERPGLRLRFAAPPRVPVAAPRPGARSFLLFLQARSTINVWSSLSRFIFSDDKAVEPYPFDRDHPAFQNNRKLNEVLMDELSDPNACRVLFNYTHFRALFYRSDTQ
jgi:hypothetical protein